MSCKVKFLSLETLKEKGGVIENDIISDLSKFDKINNELSDFAYEKYGVGSPQMKLFTTKTEVITYPGKNRVTVNKVVPNERLFSILQDAVDSYGKKLPLNQVNYSLKSVEILQSTKAIQIFEKGKKSNWDLNKILTELAIPKEQKQIILDKGLTTREEIITSLLADNSFVVEVNTATRIGDGKVNVDAMLGLKDYIPNNSIQNTQHYSNLTVPGGTNYTENEIATPAITPSIKGHAQFATDQGIGWFRSDDKVSENVQAENQYEYYDYDAGEERAGDPIESTRNDVIIPKDKFTYNGDIYERREPLFDEEDFGNISYFKNGKAITGKEFGEAFDAINQPTKTRRILEVQSDLFQKGRDKEDLVGKDRTNELTDSFELDLEIYNKDTLGNYTKFLADPFGTEQEVNITKEEYEKAYKQKYKTDYVENKTATTDNQFLQLLNKDNNWITFFVKSIIQDSAKKGYEKVLFPTGETAAKVEGHETLANELSRINSSIEEYSNDNNYELKNNLYYKRIPVTDIVNPTQEDLNRYKKNKIENLEKQKEELKSQGIEKLKPIYNFYENTVTNILNKTYGKNNVKVITDEYGNTWNSVDLFFIKNDILLDREDSKQYIPFDSNKLDELVDETVPEKLVITDRKKPAIKEAESDAHITDFILFNGIEKDTYSATEILNNIINNFNGFNKQSKEFVELSKLLVIHSKATVKVVDKSEMEEGGLMQYHPSSNTIKITKESFTRYSADRIIKGMLHEMVHSVTVNSYKNPTTIEQKMFKDFIDEAFQNYLNKSTKKDEHGFSNQEEFIAEIMTNASFQDELRSLDNVNWWDKIVDYIRTLFGASSKYNNVVRAILDIIPTTNEEFDTLEKDYILFEKEKKESDEDVYTRLDTLEDKVEHTVSRLKESLTLNLNNYRNIIKTIKDDNKRTNIESYISTLQDLQKQIDEYEGSKKIAGVIVFTKAMMGSLEYIQTSLNKIDITDEEAIMHGVNIYRNYLDTYTVVNDIERLIVNIEEDPKQNILNKEELTKIRKEIIYAKGQFSYLNEKIFVLMKKGMSFRLNDLRYFPQITKKHEKRLGKEFTNGRFPGDKTAWVMDKMLYRDSKMIQDDLQLYITELMENSTTDIAAMNVWFDSSINVSSTFVQIMNVMLTELDNKRIETERAKDKEFEQIFKELKTEKGTGDITTLYKNILEFDKEGKPYFKGKYKQAFFTEVALKIYKLRAEQKEVLNKKRIDIAAIGKAKGLQSPEYQKALKELSLLVKSGLKEIQTIEREHLDFTSDGKFEKIKDKWLSDRETLSTTEKKVLDFFDDIITKSHKQTYGQQSLITFSYGARFLELPKVTKSDTERILTGSFSGIVTDKFDNFTKTRPDDVGYTVERTGMDNEQLYSLKVHYRDATGEFDNKQQSLDLMTIMRLEFKNGNMYSIRKKAEIDLTFLVNIAKQKKYYEKKGTVKILNYRNNKLNEISGKESNTAKMMTNMLESRFYDIMNHTGTKIKGVDLNKAAGAINKTSAFFALTFNIASGTANVLNANAQLFLESFLKGHKIKASSIAKANGIYAKDLAQSIQDIYNPINLSYSNQVNELFNTRGNFDLSKASFLQDNFLKAGLDSSTLQIFQESGEHWMQSIITQAVLDGVKVMNAEGKFIDINGKVVATENEAASLLDMTIKDPITGIVSTSDKVVYTTQSMLTKYTEGGKENISMLIRKKLNDTIGNYVETDQAEIMRHWWGKLLMLYRKYLIPMGRARLRGIAYSLKNSEDLTEDEKNFSYALQEDEEGTYTSLIRFMATGLKGKKAGLLSANWAELSDYEKHNIKRAVVEVVTIYALLPLIEMLAVGLAEGGDDDDDLMYFIAYQTRRLETELSQYMSIPESYKILRSPIPSARLLETAGTIVFGIFKPSSYMEVYDRGEFKGQNKWKIKVQKQIPIVKETMKSYKSLHNYQDNLFGAGL